MIEKMNDLLLETLDYYNGFNRPLKQLIIDNGFELLHNTCIAHSPTKNIARSKKFNTKIMTELFIDDISNRVKEVSDN